MNLYNKIVLFIIPVFCHGQINILENDLTRHLNEYTQVIDYQGEYFDSYLKLNFLDSTLIFGSPMSFLNDEYTSNYSYQYTVMPFNSLHPDGILFIEQNKSVIILPRVNKPDFFYNIGFDKQLRWSEHQLDTDICMIKMGNQYNVEKFKELKILFKAFVINVNKKIPSDEAPPQLGITRPEYKNYRKTALNIKGKIESKEFVLPSYSVHKKPSIENNNYRTSVKLFEDYICQALANNQIHLDANLRGFIIIDKMGKIVEVVQEESKQNYSSKNAFFEKIALEFDKWNGAETKINPVFCKIQYYIQKKEWE